MSAYDVIVIGTGAGGGTARPAPHPLWITHGAEGLDLVGEVVRVG